MKEYIWKKKARFIELVKQGITSTNELAIRTSVKSEVAQYWLCEIYGIGEMLPKEQRKVRGFLIREEKADKLRFKRARDREFRRLYQSTYLTHREIAKQMNLCDYTISRLANKYYGTDRPTRSELRYLDFVILIETKSFTLSRISLMLQCPRYYVLGYYRRYKKTAPNPVTLDQLPKE